MLVLHHLDHSRSHRILWLLEELGLHYELVRHERDPRTRFSPDSLKAVHPLGKAPVIEDGDLKLAESGAIIDHLIERRGDGRLGPPPGAEIRYREWMHFAEGSAATPLILALYAGRLGEAAAPLRPRIESQIATHLAYMEAALEGADFFVGDAFSGCDIQLGWVVEIAERHLGAYPRLADFLARMRARPAYRRAIERGGPVVHPALAAQRR